jgi:hypothetical protein
MPLRATRLRLGQVSSRELPNVGPRHGRREAMNPETERVRAIYDRRGPALVPRDRSFLFGDARA